MSIQTHKCNQPMCNGFILFDNADFDYDEAMRELNSGYLTSTEFEKSQAKTKHLLLL